MPADPETCARLLQQARWTRLVGAVASRAALAAMLAAMGADLVGCSKPPPPQSVSVPPLAGPGSGPGPALDVSDAVFDIGALPAITTPLADDPRRPVVEALCTPCHSARYIFGQPPLEAAVWRAEVDKMVDGFGATIPDDKREVIVSYLTDHYGPSRAAVPTPATAPSSSAAVAASADDAGVYKTYCIACHGAEGRGVPGAFPPLAGHAATLGASEAGRAYMIDVVLHGLAGPIAVDGASFNGMMPPLGSRMTDAEVAAVLNGVRRTWPTSGIAFVAVAPAEVASRRADKAPGAVLGGRP